MGRSKFPGKPSKSVMKERIRVLYKNENGKSDKDGNKKNGSNSKYNGCCIQTTATESQEQRDIKLNPLTDADSSKKPQSLDDPAGRSVKTIDYENGLYEKQSDDLLGQDEETKVLASGSCAGTSVTSNPSIGITGSTQYPLKDLDKLTKKKTVTFKNVLETSDDTLLIKSIHNPLNKGPLVSIMKKECLASQGYLTRGDVIVRPSRLTEILKNNENIDKTKSLSFRSVQIKRSDLSENAKAHGTQVNQYRSPSKEDKKREFAIRNQNENLEKPEQQSIEDNYSLSLDKWKLQKFRPNSDIFETDDDQIKKECRKWSPKRKDSTSHNKIILRQPRLHFEPQSEILVKGKQNSLNSTNNVNTPINNLCTHSVCGVCNTSVGSKILQNRKYGIIACDACRKFISKITKKTVSSSTNPLTSFKIQCSKRDGECVITSLPKNNVKSFKKIYDERCSACWLRKCIKSFHFPSGHKLRLNAILSENNKSKIDIKAVNKSFDSLHSPSVNTLKYGSESLTQIDYADNAELTSLNWRLTTAPGGLTEPVKSHNVDFASVHNITEPVIDNILSDVFANSKQSQNAQPLNNDSFSTSGGKQSKFNSNSNPIKKLEPVLCKSIELQSTNTTPEFPKRQKIDFKGPRVKHVCRSASIALGQQIATFSNEDEKPSKYEQSKSENIAFTTSLLGNIYFSASDQKICSQNSIEDVEMLQNQFQDKEKVLKQGFAIKAVETQREPSKNPCASNEPNELASVKENRPIFFENSNGTNKCQFQKSAQKYGGNKNIFMLANRNVNSLSKMNLIRITKARNCEKKSKMISIDFWDTYVPAEVSQTGFGLILTESAPTCALCFLCGSMDLEYLLFCASCCEPYHSYCIQEEVNSIYAIFKDKIIAGNAENTNNLLNQLNWVCPRCTICYTCNMSSGAKIKCQKCKKNYHSTCMGTSKGLLGADRPLICRSCLKCQTCSTTKVSKYVGNQPICMQCFKLRRVDSRCPLCNNLFDNILDLIILECGICEKLIHVKCEGLTEEQSNLLSNLPENIKFVCKKCSLANDHAKALANEWREAVYEELKAGLLDVLRLLSRSRQANVLKRDVNKICRCGFQQINKNHHILSYENYKHSYIKEGSKSVNDYVLNNHIGSSKCSCSNVHFPQSKLSHSLSLFDVKKKIINGEYVSLFDFNADMNDVIMPLKNDELILAYKEILSEKFSWFQNETKTCTDALEEDMFESCNYSFQLDDVVTEDQNATIKFPELLGTVLSYLKQETDSRVCIFCLKEGDGGILQESRLLYYGYNLWVHANCAIYSNDVYEEFDGTLQNVQHALNKGRVIKCSVCKWPGATIKCSVKTCSSNYHFQCARKAKCEFLSNKSVYCSTHISKDTQKDILAKDTFTVSRPLYIESDKCRRKYVEPSKVKFAMGSLSVIQLGTVSSKYSDTSEAIVPINFACTRLYWSSKEPWKIVKYSVRTLIQHGSITFANDIENNFTIDHSNHVNLVEMGLSQIASWHNTLTHGENSDATLYHEYGQLGNHRFSTDNDNDTISDACVEEEPQNNSDLLPPEIKDAIFEDLPHDILDGISMLDIFPKLMIYEDLISIEGKPDMLSSEATENCTLQISDDCTSYSSVKKKDTNNKFPCNFVNNIEDTSLPILHSTCPKRELQRSNSEVFLRNFEGYRSQRSSSVTWGCKFDSTRRYFTKGLSDVGLSETRVYHSNCRKAEDEYDDYKLNSKNNSIFDEGKHLTQIKKDNIKLMQLDGTDDTVIGYISTQLPNSASKSPVKCDRCHCTYRSFDSFQRHLVTCEQISTSESETETSSLTPDASHSTIVFQDETLKTNLQLYHNQLASNQKFPTNISIVSEPNVISPEHIIPQTMYATNTTDYEERIYPNINKTGYSNVNKNKISINTGYDENNWQNVTSCGINSKCSDKNKNLKCNCTNSNSKANNEQYKVCTKTKQESIVTPETINNKAEYNSQGKQGYLQFLNQQLVLNNQYSQKDQQSQQQQFVVIQQSVGNNQPLFLQQVANQTAIPQNIFPVVLSNNSMQYASIPSSTNPLVQGSILQTDASGNLILSSGLQMLSMPSLQLTSQTSPQLFGTFNQPQPLHIGSNQMLIGGTSPMELMPNANQVLLAAPPVYYGLETIVQNTVMSSQQFVSTAMQGVLSQNASFSATTTQVFQSSKFEPVSDTPSGYVLLNNADGTAILVPQTNLMSGFINTNNVHDYQSNYSQDFVNIPGTHSTTFMQQPQPKNVVPLIPTIADMTNITTEGPINQIQATVNLDSHISSPGKKSDKFASKVDTIISPKSNALHQNLIHNAPICDIKVSDMEETQMVANDYGNHFNVQLICNDSEIYESQNTSANVNNIKLKNGAQVKPKVTQRYIKRSKVSKNTIVSSKAMFKNIVQKEVELNQSKEAILKSIINKSKKEIHHIDAHNVQSLPLLNTVHRNINSDSQNGKEIIDHKGFDECIENSECYLGPKVSIQNTVQKSNNRSTSESYLINTNKLPPTTTASFGSNFNNVPTNIVPPIFQTHPNNNTPSRPTNRVLPMQSIHKPVDRSKLKTLTIKRSPFRDNLNKLTDTTSSDMEMKNKPIPKQDVEQNFNISNATDPKEFALKHMIAPENDVSEIKTNSNSITDPLNLLQKLPILDKGVELKQANNSNHTIPLNDGKKYDQNTLKDKESDNIPSRNPLSDENENKSVIEVSIDTQLQKPIDEAFVKNDCLEVVKSLESSTDEVKCKSPKQLVTDQYSSRNTCQKIAICNSKKRPEIDNRKKDSEPHLIYEIQSEDGFSYKSKSAAEVWEKVFEAVQTARRLHGLSSLPIGPFADMCGVQMIGLKTNALKYLIEQLPGTENCTKYTPKYHKSAPSTVGSEYLYQDQEDLPENSYGAVRCEPFAKRSDYDLFSWLASKHRKQPKQIFVQPSDTELIARRCTANLPMAMKYRTLKESCKHNVGVFRSLIHGRGLFCIKDIEAGEMVIEYAGELIRSTLTDKRERFYDSRGIGCYMFKIDDNFVVDATMRGNAARFINHSCEPNCYSKVVDILGHKHIIIFSLRRIVQGEELTYDYKFPFEDVKIPCSCGSKKCRKYLN